MAIHTFGSNAVDWEERVDLVRLRDERLARLRAQLERSELGALLSFDFSNIRYMTSTHIGTWAMDKLIRFALLTRGGEPVVWDFGSAARHHQLYNPWLDHTPGPATPEGARQTGARAGISTLRGAFHPQAGIAEQVARQVAAELREHGVADAPLGVDVAEMPVLGSFDVVTAVYLLHYAQSKEHLGRMCRGIYQNLKPGGRFVTVVANPEFNPVGPHHAKYGVMMNQRVDAPEGSSVVVVVLTEPPIMIHTKYWTRATYEGALAEAGFRTIVWESLQPSPEAEAHFGREFWEDFLRNPFARLIHCDK